MNCGRTLGSTDYTKQQEAPRQLPRCHHEAPQCRGRSPAPVHQFFAAVPLPGLVRVLPRRIVMGWPSPRWLISHDCTTPSALLFSNLTFIEGWAAWRQVATPASLLGETSPLPLSTLCSCTAVSTAAAVLPSPRCARLVPCSDMPWRLRSFTWRLKWSQVQAHPPPAAGKQNKR